MRGRMEMNGRIRVEMGWNGRESLLLSPFSFVFSFRRRRMESSPSIIRDKILAPRFYRPVTPSVRGSAPPFEGSSGCAPVR
jgi:hypothetical protein